MQVGWDWASETPDITVIDDRGQVSTAGRLPMTRPVSTRPSVASPATASPSSCRSRSSATAGWWSTGCWLLATRSCPSIPTPSTPPGRAGVPPGPSPTPATATSWPTCCAHRQPTGCAPWTLPPATYSSSRGCATTTSRPKPRPPTSSAPCWMATGPAPRPSLPASTARSPLDFLERYPTPQAAQRLGEARLASFLRRHSYSGRRSPAELLARLRAAPVATDTLDPEVVAECVRAQVRLLRTLLGTLADLPAPSRLIRAAQPFRPRRVHLGTVAPCRRSHSPRCRA
jgi:hypothetical protein